MSSLTRILLMEKLMYKVGKISEEESMKLDFYDGLKRTIEDRIKLGFIMLRLPVIDDAPYRIFETMDDYYKWAEREVPRYLGYFRKND